MINCVYIQQNEYSAIEFSRKVSILRTQNVIWPEANVSTVAQTVKNLPAMQETSVRFMGWEVPLEKGMEIHSSILAWRTPWAEKPGGLQSLGSQRAGHD